MPYKMVTVQRLGDILKAWNNHFTQLVYTHTALVVPGTHVLQETDARKQIQQ